MGNEVDSGSVEAQKKRRAFSASLHPPPENRLGAFLSKTPVTTDEQARVHGYPEGE